MTAHLDCWVIQRNRTVGSTSREVHGRGESHRTWLAWLWRQESPTVCPVWDGGWGKLVIWFHRILEAWESGSKGERRSLGLYTWEPEVLIAQGRRRMSQVKQRDWTCPSPAFRSIHDLVGLDDAHIGVGPAASLSLLNETTIPSGNSLIDTPQNNVSPTFWASLSPVKVRHTIHHQAMKIHESDHPGRFFQEWHTTDGAQDAERALPGMRGHSWVAAVKGISWGLLKGRRKGSPRVTASQLPNMATGGKGTESIGNLPRLALTVSFFPAYDTVSSCVVHVSIQAFLMKNGTLQVSTPCF